MSNDEIRSYVTFKDGHEENILFYTKLRGTEIIFVTKSGIYLHSPSRRLACVTGADPYEFFGFRYNYSLRSLTADGFDSISEIHLDERVPYQYCFENEDGYYHHGTVLVRPDADDDQIKLSILNQLGDLDFKPIEED